MVHYCWEGCGLVGIFSFRLEVDRVEISLTKPKSYEVCRGGHAEDEVSNFPEEEAL